MYGLFVCALSPRSFPVCMFPLSVCWKFTAFTDYCVSDTIAAVWLKGEVLIGAEVWGEMELTLAPLQLCPSYFNYPRHSRESSFLSFLCLCLLCLSFSPLSPLRLLVFYIFLTWLFFFFSQMLFSSYFSSLHITQSRHRRMQQEPCISI